MGNQPAYEVQPKNSIIKSIQDTLHFRITQGNKIMRTTGLVHLSFANQFSRTEKGSVNRAMNPFCPIIINEKEWTTGCIVSPAMILAPSKKLIRQNQTLKSGSEATVIYSKEYHVLQIEKAIILKSIEMCLLILKKPFWKIGWAGIGCLKSTKQLKQQHLRFVSHPKQELDNKSDINLHIQQIKKFIHKYVEDSEGLTIKSTEKQGSLLCILIQRKPYIIGLQKSQSQLIFFPPEFIKEIQQCTSKYLTVEQQKQIIKQMDISSFERETAW